jgi:hypothetical protein
MFLEGTYPAILFPPDKSVPVNTISSVDFYRVLCYKLSSNP